MPPPDSSSTHRTLARLLLVAALLGIVLSAAFLASRQGSEPALTAGIANSDVLALDVADLDSSTEPILPETNHHFSQPQAHPARPGEVLLRFKTREAYHAFLANQREFTILGKLDGLLAVRVRADTDEVRDRLSKVASEDGPQPNYLIELPESPELNPETDGELVAFGKDYLAAIGVADNANWGQGVRVAVLDAGWEQHPAFANNNVTLVDLTQSAASGDAVGHGKAVASLLAASHPDFRGIAPASTVTAYRVLDGSGTGDSFTLAQAITAAADAGNAVISLSLGGTADSAVVRDAVAYAIARGAVLVAAAGNEGVQALSYPAAYPGVVAVGAVDATGYAPSFSNTGRGLGLVAPGVGLAAAGAGNSLVEFSGTSAAAPLVAGAIAALISTQRGLTPQQAVERLYATSDDAGLESVDATYGNGIINMRRATQVNTRGIYDASVASHAMVQSPNGRSLAVVIQNRGTETLAQAALQVRTNAGVHAQTFYQLRPNQSASLSIPVPEAATQSSAGWQVTSEITIPGRLDARGIDNSKVSNFQTPR